MYTHWQALGHTYCETDRRTNVALILVLLLYYTDQNNTLTCSLGLLHLHLRGHIICVSCLSPSPLQLFSWHFIFFLPLFSLIFSTLTLILIRHLMSIAKQHKP